MVKNSIPNTIILSGMVSAMAGLVVMIGLYVSNMFGIAELISMSGAPLYIAYLATGKLMLIFAMAGMSFSVGMTTQRAGRQVRDQKAAMGAAA